MKATLVKSNLPQFRGQAHLYRLNPPLSRFTWTFDESAPKQDEYVIVSAAIVPISGPETYIFPANPAGEITDWGELRGSQRGTLSHEQVLTDLGYEISRETEDDHEQ